MDNWLKALVAAACIVVIGGGGYYAWGEYDAYQRKNVAHQSAAKQESLKQSLSTEECQRMAKETLPEKKGDPVKTTKYNSALFACDDLNRFDANWRQALDMAGVF